MKILNILLLYIIFPGLMLFPGEIFSQSIARSFEETEQLQKEESRNILVFIHTEWCKFCKTMENTTFRDEGVRKILSDEYYFVDFDVEERSDVTYGGHVFRYKPTGRKTGVHELAEILGTVDGVLSFPALVILNPENEIIFQYGGFLDAAGLQSVLKEKRPRYNTGRKF